jgi:two-component system CheB/CheR fusion protein
LPFRTETGQVEGVVITFTDITTIKAAELKVLRLNDELEQRVEERTTELQNEIQERLRVEKLVEESRDYYLNILSEAPALIWRANTEALCDWFNNTWLAFTGRTMEQEYGNGWVEGVHSEDLDRCVTIWLDSFKVHQPFEMEYRLRRHDGEFRWILDVGCPMTALDGSFAGYIGYCFDITDRKNAESELVVAREAAEMANRTKSEFVANMSHEIRTPMNSIMGMCELMAHTELNEEQSEYMDAVQISSACLLSIINNILDLSKIEIGKIELEIADFSLRNCITDVIKTQTSIIHAKGLSIRMEIPDDIPDGLKGDQLRLKQILLNIVSNAVKFSSTGCITIAAALLDRETDNVPFLKLSVTDSGIGIASDAIERIFDPFCQEDPSITRKYGGAGLGLSITAKLVGLMGGKIQVESRKGTGSTFHVLIPYNEIDHGEAVNHPAKSSCNKLWSGKPLHLLVVDDDDDMRYIMTRLLSKCGQTWEAAKSGIEAVEKCKKTRFDVILMDIEMPGMDGSETVGSIRVSETGEGRHTPIIALTSHVFKNGRERMLGMGFDGYLTKPTHTNTLLEEITRCLDTPGDEAAPQTDISSEAVPQVDMGKLTALLREMEELLQQNNMSVLDRIGDLSKAMPDSQLLETLLRQIRQFECEKALQTITKIYEVFDIPR